MERARKFPCRVRAEPELPFYSRNTHSFYTRLIAMDSLDQDGYLHMLFVENGDYLGHGPSWTWK